MAPREGKHLLTFRTTADIAVPHVLIDQVIGQDKAVAIIRLAARQRRSVLLIGEPGTGKSMLGQAMADLLLVERLEDIVVEPNLVDRTAPVVRAVPAGQGATLLETARLAQRRAERSTRYLFGFASAGATILGSYYSLTFRSVLPMVVASAGAFLLYWLSRLTLHKPKALPRVLVDNRDRERAPFVDATGQRDGALLGDVRHDPYQSGGHETGTHLLVEPGGIHQAHGGVLFVDEAATLAMEAQQALLTAFQEKRYAITGRNSGSSGTMIRTTPAPCDFLLVLAGNLHDIEKLHPALRSRIRGYGYEVYMNVTMPDTPENQLHLARFIAQEVIRDGRIPHFEHGAVAAIIDQARRMAGEPGQLATRLRDLGGLVRAAGDLACLDGAGLVTARHVLTALAMASPLEEQLTKQRVILRKRADSSQVGRAFFVMQVAGQLPVVTGVDMHYVPRRRQRLSVVICRCHHQQDAGNFSALLPALHTVLGRLPGGTLYVDDLDVGTEAAHAFDTLGMALAALSVITGQPLSPSVCCIGKINIHGEVLPMQRFAECINVADQAGVKTLLVPRSCVDLISPGGLSAHLQVIPVSTLAEAWCAVTPARAAEDHVVLP